MKDKDLTCGEKQSCVYGVCVCVWCMCVCVCVCVYGVCVYWWCVCVYVCVCVYGVCVCGVVCVCVCVCVSVRDKGNIFTRAWCSLCAKRNFRFNKERLSDFRTHTHTRSEEHNS